MRLLYIVLILVLSAKALQWEEDYRLYNPDWEIKKPYTEVATPFQLKAAGRLKGMSCGTESMAFYNFAMMLNLDTLKELYENWKDMAFPIALYTLGVYFPVVKEAMLGAEYASNTIASLRNLNCESSLKVIESYAKKDSKIVKACVLRKLGVNKSMWDISQKDIENVLATKTRSEIDAAYDYCMNNATLLDAFGDADIKRWLNEKNPRKLIACNYAELLGLEDLGTKYNANKEILLEGGDATTYAKLFALAVTPEFVLDKDSKQLLLKPIEVDGERVSLETLNKLLKESVDKDFEVLEKLAEEGREEEFNKKVRQLNEKFFIDDDDVSGAFDLMFLGYRKLEKEKDNPAKYIQIKEALKDYVRDLKDVYVTLRRESVLREIDKQFYQMQVKMQASETGGGLQCSE